MASAPSSWRAVIDNSSLDQVEKDNLSGLIIAGKINRDDIVLGTRDEVLRAVLLACTGTGAAAFYVFHFPRHLIHLNFVFRRGCWSRRRYVRHVVVCGFKCNVWSH